MPWAGDYAKHFLCIISYEPLMALWSRYFPHVHFTDKETEGLRGKVTQQVYITTQDLILGRLPLAPCSQHCLACMVRDSSMEEEGGKTGRTSAVGPGRAS